MKSNLTLSFLLVIFSIPAFAQSQTVTGKVTDSKDNSPVAGATIKIKGGKAGSRFTK